MELDWSNVYTRFVYCSEFSKGLGGKKQNKPPTDYYCVLLIYSGVLIVYATQSGNVRIFGYQTSTQNVFTLPNAVVYRYNTAAARVRGRFQRAKDDSYDVADTV